MNKSLLVLGVMLIMGFLFFGCFGQQVSSNNSINNPPVNNTPPFNSTPPINNSNTTVVPPVNNTNSTITPPTNNTNSTTTIEINMTAKQFGFDPGVVKVKKGDHIRIKITSADVDHGFAIAAYGINQKIAGGATEVIEFTADKEGEFDFICSVPCGELHRMMRGKLIVEA